MANGEKEKYLCIECLLSEASAVRCKLKVRYGAAV